jgi:phosphoglycolate phosphatase-like HAD superfamily hydrolase
MGTAAELAALRPHHETLVGIDSDGCVFDSMAVKQTQCFHPAFLDTWDLWSREAPARACLEFVNLYSRTRGQDRFVCLLLAVDLMRSHPDLGPDTVLPDVTDLERWLEAGPPFGNAGLEQAVAGAKGAHLKDSPSLRRILDWSRDVDRRVAALAPIPPFPEARRFLETAGSRSDLMVVSSTPLAALEHEWQGCGLRDRVRFICSKDLGTKTQHLRAATDGDRYALERVLMVGDAPKDLESAREAGVRFFPILPGAENASWTRLADEVHPAWLAGGYTRDEERELEEAFLDLLPETPPWA